MGRDSFSGYNPVIIIMFYVLAIGLGVFFVHPAFVVCSVVLSAAYYVTLKGREAFKLVLGLLPVFILISAINPIFNRYGETVLFTWGGGREYTFEALCYGMALGGIFISVMLWFASYNINMTSDKFMHAFGRMAPSASLLITMVFRLVPAFGVKATQMAAARASIENVEGKGFKQKLKSGTAISSALISWALEGGIITSDSMKSRGYGCGKRTAFARYRFDSRDRVALILMVALMIITIGAGVLGTSNTTYTPELHFEGINNPYAVIGVISYFLLLAMPTAVNIVEEITWHILRSKI